MAMNHIRKEVYPSNQWFNQAFAFYKEALPGTLDTRETNVIEFAQKHGVEEFQRLQRLVAVGSQFVCISEDLKTSIKILNQTRESNLEFENQKWTFLKEHIRKEQLAIDNLKKGIRDEPYSKESDNQSEYYTYHGSVEDSIKLIEEDMLRVQYSIQEVEKILSKY